MAKGEDIHREIALKLCDEIRAENQRKWFSTERIQCWGCYKWAKGNVEKMCLSNERGGCNLINKRYKLYQGDK